MADHDRWARLRFAIIGPLLAAPPERGELHQALARLAGQAWQHPVDGTVIRFSIPTLERWYYAARRAADPVAKLRRSLRQDAGQFRTLSAALIAAIDHQYQAHSSWSVQLHYDNLVALSQEQSALQPMPSYATLRRYLKARGYYRRKKPRQDTPGGRQAEYRLQHLEVRSYEAEYVHGLWHADFHQGSRRVLIASGRWVTPQLVCFMDDHSRLVCHLQWYLAETAEMFVHGLSQALQKRGLPRALMTDNGSAMLAEEVRCGLQMLGIVHETTLPYSPYQNAKQETFWATLEGRLMAMLEGIQDLTLSHLNEVTQAWVEQSYHRTRHSELQATPLERYLEAPEVGRPCPDSQTVRSAFRGLVERRQRRSDGTFSLQGTRFEIPGRYRHLEKVLVRYARWDLSAVEMIDPQTLASLCRLYPLNKQANADGQRRSLEPTQKPPTAEPEQTLPPLLRQCLAEYAATGRPPAYIPYPESETDE